MILEVDLEYPPELHQLHNNYPLAPEKLLVKSEMLSDYCTKILEGEEGGKGGVMIPFHAPILTKFTRHVQF